MSTGPRLVEVQPPYVALLYIANLPYSRYPNVPKITLAPLQLPAHVADFVAAAWVPWITPEAVTCHVIGAALQAKIRPQNDEIQSWHDRFYVVAALLLEIELK